MKINACAALAAILFLSLSRISAAHVQDTVTVHNTILPVITDREHNVIAEFCIHNDSDSLLVLDNVNVRVSGPASSSLDRISLMYSGTMSVLYSETSSYVLRDAFRHIGAGQQIFCHPAYVMEQSSSGIRSKSSEGTGIALASGKKLIKGENWFYVSGSIDSRRIKNMADTFTLEITGISLNGNPAVILNEGSTEHRPATGVRQYMDDGVFVYRIPGLATANDGSLIAVYDVRHTSGMDLQDNIDVGMSRSLDKGVSWEKMKIIMDMGEWGGLPQAQNGIGDPCVVVDSGTGEIFVVAVWTYGLGNNHAWSQVGQGFSPEETAQMMIVSSKDNGKTWSAPRNITSQVKQKDWCFTLQGPGRGISMKDGTLVVPIQYQDASRIPHSGIMFSKDHGKTWKAYPGACPRTTEAQVAEIRPGVLMLNMRNDRKTGRVVYTTSDLGKTWTEHPGSEILREPVCMGSLLHVDAGSNVLGRDILFFSNPDTKSGRNHITVKASLDGGMTWPEEFQILLDEEEGWGYSCMTQIDENTIGILYEGSTSHLVFSSVRIKDIVKIPSLSMGCAYSDGMVLPMNTELHITGTACPGAEVRARIAGQDVSTVADSSGIWDLTLEPLDAGTGYEMTVASGNEELVFKDVAAGEVWICSGQSNMEFPLRGSYEARKYIEKSLDPDLRFYSMKSTLTTYGVEWSGQDASRVNNMEYFSPAHWENSAPGTASGVSAVAYYFGKMLRDSLNVPVGLIMNAVGGTTTESWVDREALAEKYPAILCDWYHNGLVMEWARERAALNMAKCSTGNRRHPFTPGYLFNAGIKPLGHFPVTGAVWYQGESNANNVESHERLFRLLVESWRKYWDNDSMPFYFVQLSSIDRPEWPLFRDSQRRLMNEIPHTGMAVSSDKGNRSDVHPIYKKEIGERLALWRLHDSWNKDIVPSGPLFREAVRTEQGVVVSFDYADSLKTSDGNAPECFELAGKDRIFHPATASLAGNVAVLHSDDVPDPEYVRYAWQPYTEANLVNESGLPASTFISEISSSVIHIDGKRADEHDGLELKYRQSLLFICKLQSLKFIPVSAGEVRDRHRHTVVLRRNS